MLTLWPVSVAPVWSRMTWRCCFPAQEPKSRPSSSFSELSSSSSRQHRDVRKQEHFVCASLASELLQSHHFLLSPPGRTTRWLWSRWAQWRRPSSLSSSSTTTIWERTITFGSPSPSPPSDISVQILDGSATLQSFQWVSQASSAALISFLRGISPGNSRHGSDFHLTRVRNSEMMFRIWIWKFLHSFGFFCVAFF